MAPPLGTPKENPIRWTPAKRQALADGFDAGYGMQAHWNAVPFTYGTARWHIWLLGFRRGRHASHRERKG